MNYRTIRGHREIGATVGGLLRFTSAGEVFMGPDNKPVVLPLEVIPFNDGWIVFRIGETTYWFNEKGEFDGVEVNAGGAMSDELYERELLSMLKKCRENRGKPALPDYFGDERGLKTSWSEPT